MKVISIAHRGPARLLAVVFAGLCLSAVSVDAHAGTVGALLTSDLADSRSYGQGSVHRIKDAAPAADDTGRNVRDRDNQTLTPSDQSNDPHDLKLTRDIRKALVADDTLSTTAKNIKIITVHGKVTLRGPVDTVKEKAKIGKKAAKLAKGPVDNQLEVASR